MHKSSQSLKYKVVSVCVGHYNYGLAGLRHFIPFYGRYSSALCYGWCRSILVWKAARRMCVMGWWDCWNSFLVVDLMWFCRLCDNFRARVCVLACLLLRVCLPLSAWRCSLTVCPQCICCTLASFYPCDFDLFQWCDILVEHGASDGASVVELDKNVISKWFDKLIRFDFFLKKSNKT